MVITGDFYGIQSMCDLVLTEFAATTGCEPQCSVQLPYKWRNSMVYDRYNELVN